MVLAVIAGNTQVHLPRAVDFDCVRNNAGGIDTRVGRISRKLHQNRSWRESCLHAISYFHERVVAAIERDKGRLRSLLNIYVGESVGIERIIQPAFAKVSAA